MEERFNRIDEKLDKLADAQATMNTTLTRLTGIVDTHEQRSTTLEKIVLPMKERELQAQGVARFLRWLGSFIVGACAVAEVLHWLIK